MIDDNGIALDHTVDIGITPVSSVCDLSVLQDFDGHLHCVNRCATVFENQHSRFASTKEISVISRERESDAMFQTYSSHARR
jgi:hypothetical protein